MLDEPVNGLDPEGILWIRNLLKGLAAEGRTVFVSSHLMSEMALTAEHLDRHRQGPAARRPADRRGARGGVAARRCRSAARRRRGWRAAGRAGRRDHPAGGGRAGGHRADRRTDRRSRPGRRGIAVHELTPQQASLEEAFMELTNDSIEFHGGTPVARRPRPKPGCVGMTAAVPGYVSPVEVQPVTQRSVIGSEWFKLTSLRSSWITMVLGLGALGFLGGVVGFFTQPRLGPDAAGPAGRVRRGGHQPGRRPVRPVGDRGARRAVRHRRVRHRHDPVVVDRRPDPTAGAVGQGRGVRRGHPGDHRDLRVHRLLRRPGHSRDPLRAAVRGRRAARGRSGPGCT